MKKTVYTVLFLMVFVIILMACEKSKKGSITGQINGTDLTSFLIDQQTVSLDEQGNFQFVLQINKPSYVELDYGKKIAVYIKPGDTLHINIDNSKEAKEGIQFSGDNSAINQLLLQEAVQSQRLNEEFNNKFMQLISMDELEFKAKMDSLWKPFYDGFYGLLNEKKINDPYFIKSHEGLFLYTKADILMKYPEWKRLLTDEPDFSPSPGYYDFISELDLNDPELMDLDEYRDFLLTYLSVMTEKELKESSSLYENKNYKQFRAKMKIALETFTDPDVRNEMLYSFMNYFFDSYYQKETDDLIETYKKNCTDPEHIAEMEEYLKRDRSIQEQCEIRVYKTVDDVTLDAYIYMPSDLKEGEKRPAVAFFHGGGWECGKPEWGHTQCRHFSSLGLVGISFEYRLLTQHDSTLADCVKDAKSALRWMRAHKDELHIDPERITVSGFSAGGHLCLCTAMIDGFDEPYEDLSVSSAPQAMLLWVTPPKIHEDRWFVQILKGQAEVRDIDPSSHIRPGLPPCVFFQGTNDDTVSPDAVKDFVGKMKDAGNRCDLHLFEGQTHLGWDKSGNEADVLAKMDAFLESIGFLRH